MPYPERLAGDDGPESKIILSESDAREAVRLLGLLTDALGKKDEEVADAGSPGQISRHELRLRARVVINSRRYRFGFFKRSMFGEPAWDMLLVLYITEPAEGCLSISQLADLVETPLSTAVRWIDYLEREKLVEREPHPTDKRVIFIRLSEKGREKIDGYLCGQPWVPA